MTKGRILLGLLCAALMFGFWPSRGQTPHSITLTWAASGTAGVKYVVFRSTSSTGTFTQIATDVVALTYTDTAGVGGTTYYYTIAAICDSTTACPAGISGQSAQTPPSAGVVFLGSPQAPAGAPVAVAN